MFQFLDMYSNVIDNAGTRVDGPGGATVTLVPPGYTAPVPGRRIESTTWDLWVLGRTLVGGAGVDPQALQRGYRIGVNRVPVAGATPRLRQQSCTVGAVPSLAPNWLPAPAGGFQLIFRQYIPTDTGWVPPPIVPV